MALQNVGEKSVHEIARLIGGWKSPPRASRAEKAAMLVRLQQQIDAVHGAHR